MVGETSHITLSKSQPESVSFCNSFSQSGVPFSNLPQALFAIRALDIKFGKNNKCLWHKNNYDLLSTYHG